MAFQAYEDDQSIHSMTTRQLRLYISQKAKEAQLRADTLPDDASKAVMEAYDDIADRNGRIKAGTSTMSKAEMREYAYKLRTFNKLDVESKYAEKTEYQQNKQRYETFIRNQLAKGGSENQYWAQYLTPKGNVSKRGYQDYKDFISTIKATEQYLEQFGYREIEKFAEGNKKDPGNKILNKILAQVYSESKGKGWTQAQLIDKAKKRYAEALAEKKEKSKVSVPKVKTKQKKSTTTIKVKKTGKMKAHGTVHNRLT